MDDSCKITQLIAVGKTRFYILVGNRTFSPNFFGDCSGMVKAKTEHQWSVAWHPSKWHRTIWSKKKSTPFNICVNVAHGIGFAAPDANCVCVFFFLQGLGKALWQEGQRGGRCWAETDWNRLEYIPAWRYLRFIKLWMKRVTKHNGIAYPCGS